MSLINRVKNLFFPHVSHESYESKNAQMTMVDVPHSPVKAWEEALPSEYAHTDFKDLPKEWRYQYVISVAKLYDMAMPKKLELVGKMLNMIALSLFEHQVMNFGCSMSLEDNATQKNTVLEQFHLSVGVLMGQRAEVEPVQDSANTRAEKKIASVSSHETQVMSLYTQCAMALRAKDERDVAKLCAMVLAIFECASRDNYHVFDATLKKPYNAHEQAKHEYYALFKRTVQKG